MKILTIEQTILAQGDIRLNGQYVTVFCADGTTPDVNFQVSQIPGYQISDVSVPADFQCENYIFDGNAVQIKIDPDASEKLQKARLDKWEEIKSFRDNRLLGGGFPAAGHWYYSDLLARSQHQSNARKADLVAAANGDMDATFLIDGNPLYIKTIDNGYMAMTANIAIEIMANAEIQEYKNYSVALVHKSAMSASPNPSSYDFSTGWPEAFGVD